MPDLSIKLINFMGDEAEDVYLIGPYDTADARNRDLVRIAGLPGVAGNVFLTASTLAPSQAHRPVGSLAVVYTATPGDVADVKDVDGLLDAFRVAV